MVIERLTAADELMLWPEDRWPQHIAALAILDGRSLFAPDGRFRIEVVRDLVASRLHLVPRFRQVLQVPPRGLGRPLWVDATAFHLEEHVRFDWLASPADEAQLLAATERLRSRRLDRSRPLWEMWFLPGLPHGRVAWFLKLHHAIADGVAGVATIGAFLDVDAGRSTPRPPPWTPAPPPSADALRADARRRRIEHLRRVGSNVTHPLRTARELRGACPALRELFADEVLPATSLNQFVGPHRNMLLIRSRLELFKDVAHAHGATVNDVLLTATAGGLRGLLVSRGESVDDLVMRIDVPVSFRLAQQTEAQGNQIGEMVVPLAIGVSDAGQRLDRIRAATTERKARVRPSLGVFPHRGILGRTVLKLIDRQHVNVASTNLPGPPVSVYLAGAPVLEVFPVLPLLGKQAIAVAALSYAGQFNIMAIADADSCPDLGVFATCFRDELLALGAATLAA
jgi:diacylglycerol O-acyltransferase